MSLAYWIGVVAPISAATFWAGWVFGNGSGYSEGHREGYADCRCDELLEKP